MRLKGAPAWFFLPALNWSILVYRICYSRASLVAILLNLWASLWYLSSLKFANLSYFFSNSWARARWSATAKSLSKRSLSKHKKSVNVTWYVMTTCRVWIMHKCWVNIFMISTCALLQAAHLNSLFVFHSSLLGQPMFLTRSALVLGKMSLKVVRYSYCYIFNSNTKSIH